MPQPKDFFLWKKFHMKNLLGGLLAAAFAFYLYMAAFQLGPAAQQLEQLASGAIEVPDLTLYQSPIALNDAFFTPLGASGRTYYLHLSSVIDTWYPISYCLFLGLAILFMTQKARMENPIFKYLALWPAVTLLADLMENYNLQKLTTIYPEIDLAAFSAYQTFWVLKFGSFLMGIIWVLVLGVIAIKKAYSNTMQAKKSI